MVTGEADDLTPSFSEIRITPRDEEFVEGQRVELTAQKDESSTELRTVAVYECRYFKAEKVWHRPRMFLTAMGFVLSMIVVLLQLLPEGELTPAQVARLATACGTVAAILFTSATLMGNAGKYDQYKKGKQRLDRTVREELRVGEWFAADSVASVQTKRPASQRRPS